MGICLALGYLSWKTGGILSITNPKPEALHSQSPKLHFEALNPQPYILNQAPQVPPAASTANRAVQPHHTSLANHLHSDSLIAAGDRYPAGVSEWYMSCGR